ncbi:MAG TPA: 4-(cytidine 5'-diphospho)-2-C-methyl-D-erythritol kinase [Parafilimonas sp.]|nr:4-(cytidine 5'-diphospho)-2-C-methyl-D-erythritol kinase [Parafilimonas sp.]
MIVFPNCKINLGLNIISKRDDGYHNLETVFYPLPFYDVLEIIKSDNNKNELFISGIEIEGEQQNNLCLKAYNLLKKDFPDLPYVKIYLQKNIPAGAGLGGGSADGAFMLKLLNEKFNLNLSEIQLLHYALQLGSDCPFFIINKPCFAQQRGEVLEKIELDFSAYKILLINPQIYINTSWAFTQINLSAPSLSVKEIIQKPVSEWKQHLKNDFESTVFEAHPSIKKIKDNLYEMGATYAAMSGSGSTVFGIFNKTDDISQHEFPENYFLKELLL